MGVKAFVKQWSGHGYEKGEAQTFWLTLIRDVFNTDKPENFIKFEEHVTSGFIDGYFPDSKVLVEQKIKWTSESSDIAAVNCVVIGMADKAVPTNKRIVFIESRARHYQKGVPRIFLGNKPTDGVNLILSPAERVELLKREPALEKFIYRYVGGNEFINNVERYCLRLVNATPDELRKSKELYRRLEAVKKMREASSSASTRQSAATPYKFFSTPQKDTTCIVIPRVSSERRKYIPIGFVEPTIIVSDAVSFRDINKFNTYGVDASGLRTVAFGLSIFG